MLISRNQSMSVEIWKILIHDFHWFPFLFQKLHILLVCYFVYPNYLFVYFIFFKYSNAISMIPRIEISSESTSLSRPNIVWFQKEICLSNVVWKMVLSWWDGLKRKVYDAPCKSPTSQKDCGEFFLSWVLERTEQEALMRARCFGLTVHLVRDEVWVAVQGIKC